MKRAGLWILVIGALWAVACSKGGFSARVSAGKENVLRYPIITITTLDPGIVQDGDTIDIIQQVFEGLVTWGEDNQVKPLLAESWDIQDGGRTYVFKIKQGVKFHSGRELTAEDFKWTIERNCDPAFRSPTATTYLGDIVGVTEKADGKASEVSGVQVVDPYTLKIQIDKPRPYFLGKLTYIVSGVVDREAVPQKRRNERGDWEWPEVGSVKQMVGTGPFMAASYSPEQLLVLSSFEDHHEGPPPLAKIERPVIKDAATRLNKYRAGELDILPLPRQDVEGVKKDPELSQHLNYFDRPSLYYVGLNLKGYKQFRDVRVRRAIAMAIDREKICKEYLSGMNPLANGIVPPGVLGHRPNAKALPYDPQAATALLADAGYPGGRGFPAMTLYFREGQPDVRIVSEAVAIQLEQNLGLQVSLQTLEWRNYLEKHNRDELPLFHMRWAADYLDRENFLSFLLAGYGPENHVGYQNPRYDELCRQADSELDTDKRLKLYAEAEDLVLQEAPFVPVYFQRDAELIRPRVKGLRESLFGHLPHKTVRLEE